MLKLEQEFVTEDERNNPEEAGKQLLGELKEICKDKLLVDHYRFMLEGFDPKGGDAQMIRADLMQDIARIKA